MPYPVSVPDGTRSNANLAAVVLAAGKGSRLHPFTRDLPKPLLTVLDRPIIDSLLHTVRELGSETVLVNLFHGAELLRHHLADVGGPRLAWRTERRLSGPAGALRLFRDELAAYDAVVVVSGDVTVEDDLTGLVAEHLVADADLTFAVAMATGASRYGVLDIDPDGRVRGAREKPRVPDHERHAISAGIYCLRPDVIRFIPSDRTYDFARDLAPALLSSGRSVHAHRLSGRWSDLGTSDALYEANLAALERSEDCSRGEVPRLPGGGSAEGKVFLGEGARVGPGSVVRGPSVIGRGAVVGQECWIERSVLLPGSVVAPGSVVIGALVAPSARPGKS